MQQAGDSEEIVIAEAGTHAWFWWLPLHLRNLVRPGAGRPGPAGGAHPRHPGPAFDVDEVAVLRCRGPPVSVPGVTRSARPFWLQPKWLVGHVLVVVLVVAFVNFGFWQLRRLDEKRTVNAAIEARSTLPVQPIDQIVDPGAGFDDVAGLVYRRVSARGTYDADATVLVRSRSLASRPGFHVLTPLLTDDGAALMVNRGFAPFSADPAEVRAATRPPQGEVEVTGLVLATQERAGIGPTDPAEGVLTEIARVDLARLQAQYRADLYPLYLQVTDQVPAPPAGGLPIALPEPEQSEGSHLSYAAQWFVFAAIGAGGWPLLLRNTGREGNRDGDGDPPPFLVAPAVPETVDAAMNEGGSECEPVSKP